MGVVPKEQAAYIAMGGRTDLTIRLREPVVLHGLLKPTIPVRTIHFTADEPDRLAGALRERAGLESREAPSTAPEPLALPISM
jgi:hypothetical protein